MTRCQWTEGCVFFADEVGYSIDLQAAMRNRYCLGDNSGCARLDAMNDLPREEIPNDLIPTERERLVELAAAYRKRCGGNP